MIDDNRMITPTLRPHLALLALLFTFFLAMPAKAQLWDNAYFRGTANNWEVAALDYNATTQTWQTTQTFSTDNPRFKITRFDNWSEAYPANDYLVTQGEGRYQISFNDNNHAITLTKLATAPATPIAEHAICYDNPDNFAQGYVYLWNANPVQSVTNLDQWPGYPLTKIDNYLCFDLMPLLQGDIKPNSINVIFHNNAGQQTDDLLFNEAACFNDNQWQSLTSCGFNPEEPEFTLDVGADLNVEAGGIVTLSANPSNGAISTLEWSSDAWDGVLSGNLINSPALTVAGSYTVTATAISSADALASDSFLLTVDPAPVADQVNANSVCFSNPDHYQAPHIYLWDAAPAGSLTATSGWPGDAMTQVGEVYCFDLTPYLLGVMPESVNVIFNNADAQQTPDLTFTTNACYTAQGWRALAECGVSLGDQKPLANAGEDRVISIGSSVNLSALGSSGVYQEARWSSDEWPDTLIGEQVTSPVFTRAGEYTVTLTLMAANGVTDSDVLQVTVIADGSAPGMSERLLLAQPHNLPIEGSVSQGNYRFEVAYPNLTNQFMSPVMIIPEPISGLMFVVDKPGVIYAFPDTATVTPADVLTLLDISAQVKNYHEQGLLSIAFDPNYASNGFIYGYYINGSDDNEREANGQFGDGVLQRWSINDPYNPTSINAGSATELLRIAQPGPDHKGGMLQFSPEDNYLYLSVGDGAYGHSAITAYPEDPRTNNNAQVTSNLLGTIIRINPIEQALNGKYYEVPSDNPFVGVPGFRPEIWSYGHRNPWRWAFDSEAPYTLWETEVGQAGFEEVNLIEKGKNYGWPICEGSNNRGDLGGDSSKDCSTDFEPPREGYNHPVGRSIIGGVVYRGNALPGLSGRFVFGDYVTKKIWAIADGEAKTLVSDAFPENIASFGTGIDGESLLVSTYGVEYGGNSTIYRVLDDDAERAIIPAQLSATGLFASLQPLVPLTGVIEYQVNSPGWFDGAELRHFMVIPKDKAISFSATDDWSLPIGSVLIKHKTVSATDGSSVPFTTSVLFRQQDGKWQAANYLWNSDHSDATLVAETTTVSNTDAEGRERAVQSAADCGSCHTGNGSRDPLAMHTRQLNRDFNYAGVIDNQIDALNYVAMFTSGIDSADHYQAFSALEDTTASETQRAKAYLATNCAHCHSSSFMDLRYDTPLADMKLLNVQTTGGKYRLKPFSPTDSLLHIYQVTDGNRMPKGTLYTNPEADTFFNDWITAAGAQQIALRIVMDDTTNPGDAISAQIEAVYDNGFNAAVDTITAATTSHPEILEVESITGNTVVLRALAVGSASVTVQAEGYVSTADVTVVGADTAVTAIAISPAQVTVATQQQLVAYGLRADGSKVNLFGLASWQVTAGANAITVDDQGILRRIGDGPGTVTAQVGELVASAEIIAPVQGLALRYDNSNNWENVYAHLWVTVNGVDQPLAPWPGVAMTADNDGNWWSYYIEPDLLPNGSVNVVFNNNDNGEQSENIIDVSESSSYQNGELQRWDGGDANGADIYRLAVIGGSTANNERDFPQGSVVTVTADTPPLGTEFSGWQGDGAAFIVGALSTPVAQVLIPEHNVSLQALFTGSVDEYQAGRDLYAAQCASCHGSDGSGGVAKAVNNLDNTWNQSLLSSYIANFMPMDNTASCSGNSEGECAFEISSMMINDAWEQKVCTGAECEGNAIDARNLRLLTKEEYLNSVRDIFNINFATEIMNTVPTDGRYRNFTTASYLTSDYDRTLGYQMVAKELTEQAITRYTFNGLEVGCQDARCAINGLGKRLFRRPLSSTEADAYVALYSADDAGRSALQAMLMSPHFMYRSELGQLNAESGLYQLSPYEIVTSLAYTFWGTTPDATLLAAATEGDIDINSLFTYVLNDARAEQGLRRFINGWLINNQYPFPAISDTDLVVALKEETVRFVLENIESNMPFSELLLAEYTQANDLVADHYDLAGSAAGGWGQRSYAADDPRSGAGLLGHASFLASRTNTINPSPIKRGVFVREMLMCQEFPPPAAANFDITFEADDSNRDATSRHTSEPACRACHQFIDGIGFGFERYDSQGLYRVIETLGNGETQTIDASGSIKSLYSPETVMDPDSEAVPYHSIAELAELIAGSGQGEACFARQFYRYLVGREENELSDEIIIRTFSQDLRNGGGMRDMLKDLVLSESFTQRR
ncbi:starch-binding protein [Gilvimarinus polysaccharolyticus]|uniref:starch-binding protein n=1 Tax=Gilvimarinus polysaccharolyticus TaxID=863921 RepID=UPI0006734727|nr:starch-binding protein [Gilvimarinus polysaccharolyticus]